MKSTLLLKKFYIDGKEFVRSDEIKEYCDSLNLNYENIIRYLSDVERVECIILLLLPYPPNISFQIGRRVANIITSKNKPVVCFVPYVAKYSMIIESLELANIPVFHSIKETVQAVSALKQRTRMDSLKLRNMFGNDK